jgi:hypothetical protein
MEPSGQNQGFKQQGGGHTELVPAVFSDPEPELAVISDPEPELAVFSDPEPELAVQPSGQKAMPPSV